MKDKKFLSKKEKDLIKLNKSLKSQLINKIEIEKKLRKELRTKIIQNYIILIGLMLTLAFY